jgi:hypothetical protein
MGTKGQKRCHVEGKCMKKLSSSCGRQKYMERLSCQMTNIKWECLRKKKLINFGIETSQFGFYFSLLRLFYLSAVTQYYLTHCS